MLINYDPAKAPKPPLEMIDEAIAAGMQLLHVLCLDRTTTNGENSVAFFVIAPQLPAKGDILRLEDGRLCIVEHNKWNLSTKRNRKGKATSIYMFPMVVAYLAPGAAGQPEK